MRGSIHFAERGRHDENYEKWVVSLKQVIAQLQKENADLKTKCSEKCEEKDSKNGGQ